MKNEQALEHLSVNSPVKDFVNNGNIKAICLAAMEAQSLAFAEWIETTNWVRSSQDNRWYSFDVQDNGITTAYLYQIFSKTN